MNDILEYLDELFPNAYCELKYNKDYELLIAIVLSAKTTDNIIISLSLVHVSILDDVQKQQRIFDNKLSKQSNAHFVIMFNCILITLVRASRGVLLIQCKRKSDIL